MLKKILIGSALFFTSLSVVHAGVYMGPTLILRDTVTKNSTTREISGRLSLGYGEYLDSALYLAGEAFLLPGAIMLTNNTSSGDSAKSTYAFGLSLIPGIKITDLSMGYVRVGIIDSCFSSASATRPGLQLGLGLQTALNQNWDIRAEYDYTVYRSITSVGTPKSDWVGLGAIYKFDAE
jgi:hypothetical protein